MCETLFCYLCPLKRKQKLTNPLIALVVTLELSLLIWDVLKGLRKIFSIFSEYSFKNSLIFPKKTHSLEL